MPGALLFCEDEGALPTGMPRQAYVIRPNETSPAPFRPPWAFQALPCRSHHAKEAPGTSGERLPGAVDSGAHGGSGLSLGIWGTRAES